MLAKISTGLAVRVRRLTIAALVPLVAGLATGAQLGTAGAGATSAAAPGAVPPSLFPAPNEFLYVRSKGAFLECEGSGTMTCRVGPRRLRELWTSERRSGRVIVRPAVPNRPPPGSGPLPLTLGNRGFSHAHLARYAPTGAQLLAELQAGRAPSQGTGGESFPFEQLTDALRNRPMPARVRRAIVDAFALIPGVSQLGERHDSLGRHGVAFSRTLPSTREEVILDPVALVLLEERTILLDESAAPGAGKKPGEQISGAVYLKRAVVKRAGDRP